MLRTTDLHKPLPSQRSEERGDPNTFPPLGVGIKVLLVWPRFPRSFWSFEAMLDLVPEKTVHPPLGLLTVAALCPKSWKLKLVNRNFQDLLDSDLLWADLVMVSGMAVQKDDIRTTLLRARALGKRTMMGGPYASSEPEVLLRLADHVVVGEPDEIFDGIAADLERGSAKRLYVIKEKPDITNTPVPRFDLIQINKYISMAVQFSRGCPFQCEFCDIITIYGRKPRTKSPPQLLAELDALFEMGWSDLVFIVDDNFIGNHKRALELARSLEEWQKSHNFPFMFYTEASLDLSQRPELIEAMVKANFYYVFIGIESPSAASLTEAKKYQNLRGDQMDSIRFIQSQGLWVTAGFIVGFDSDPEDIFERQTDFIERAAIPWAMAGFLHALNTTPLHERMVRQERLLAETTGDNLDRPNFRTLLPLPSLLQGFRQTLLSLYSPSAYFDRAYRSLAQWETRAEQKATPHPFLLMLGVIARSVYHQGLFSSYRKQYWQFLLRLLTRWFRNPPKLSMGITILLSGHHFINYAQGVAAELEAECRKLAM
ncbi:MAG: B12-binding domain-containing radical SAM protein [Terriglobia bacterium]